MFRQTSGDTLVRFDQVDQPTPIVASPSGQNGPCASDLSVSCADVLLPQSAWSTPSVVRATGVIDEASRLTFADAKHAKVIPTGGDDTRLTYVIETTLEIVKVSCR